MPKKPEIKNVREADENNVVLTIEGGNGAYRKQPCEECPWRVENNGSFPAEAFRHSARTSYDQAQHTFACHMSGAKAPAICAGFILRADHNLTLRMMSAFGKLDLDKVSEDGAELHDNYRSMAEANGVDSDDPCLDESR